MDAKQTKPPTPSALRNADSMGEARTTPTDQSTPFPLSWEDHRGVDDPQQQYSLWRLCPCQDCDGRGKTPVFAPGFDFTITGSQRCDMCRGEGKRLELIATAGTAEAVGVALVTLGMEGEWDDCPIGLLDSEGATGRKWLVKPWGPSPRNASDAGRVLRRRRDIQSS